MEGRNAPRHEVKIGSTNWFIYWQEKTHGPYSTSRMQRGFEKGQIPSSALICREGDAEWSRATSFDLLLAEATSPAKAVPTPGAAVDNPQQTHSTPASQTTTTNLQPCPDCGKNVSKRAASCPLCGCPLKGKAVESRLSVARSAVMEGSLWTMQVSIDGNATFALQAGERGSCLLQPGQHTLSATTGGGGFFGSSGDLNFSIEMGEHRQYLIDPNGGFLSNTMVFTECVLEGYFDH